MDNILEEVLKLDLQNWINSTWLPDPFTENSALHMLFTNSKNLYGYFLPGQVHVTSSAVLYLVT